MKNGELKCVDMHRIHGKCEYNGAQALRRYRVIEDIRVDVGFMLWMLTCEKNNVVPQGHGRKPQRHLTVEGEVLVRMKVDPTTIWQMMSNQLL